MTILIDYEDLDDANIALTSAAYPGAVNITLR